MSDENTFSELTINLSHDPRALTIPHLDQYFGPWAIEADRFKQFAGVLGRLDLAIHVKARNETTVEARAVRGKAFKVENGSIAVIEIRGAMTKFGSSMSESGSTIQARRAIRAAANDETVGQILLIIDSPGGTVAGTKELADDVAAANKIKPVTVQVEDMAASAAYWAASAASLDA